MGARLDPVNILSVEDNPADARLILELFKASSIPFSLQFLRDGAEALAFLNGRAPFENSRKPDLILLDLNLPKKDGREVLREIKADPELCTIPVLVLTTSSSEDDIVKCYELHANSFITKPAELERFAAIIEAIGQFWLAAAALPRQLPRKTA